MGELSPTRLAGQPPPQERGVGETMARITRVWEHETVGPDREARQQKGSFSGSMEEQSLLLVGCGAP